MEMDITEGKMKKAELLKGGWTLFLIEMHKGKLVVREEVLTLMMTNVNLRKLPVLCKLEFIQIVK